MKNKKIFHRKWPSTGRLDTHLAKSLERGTDGGMNEWMGRQTGIRMKQQEKRN